MNLCVLAKPSFSFYIVLSYLYYAQSYRISAYTPKQPDEQGNIVPGPIASASSRSIAMRPAVKTEIEVVSNRQCTTHYKNAGLCAFASLRLKNTPVS